MTMQGRSLSLQHEVWPTLRFREASGEWNGTLRRRNSTTIQVHLKGGMSKISASFCADESHC